MIFVNIQRTFWYHKVPHQQLDARKHRSSKGHLRKHPRQDNRWFDSCIMIIASLVRSWWITVRYFNNGLYQPTAQHCHHSPAYVWSSLQEPLNMVRRMMNIMSRPISQVISRSSPLMSLVMQTNGFQSPGDQLLCGQPSFVVALFSSYTSLLSSLLTPPKHQSVKNGSLRWVCQCESWECMRFSHLPLRFINKPNWAAHGADGLLSA